MSIDGLWSGMRRVIRRCGAVGTSLAGAALLAGCDIPVLDPKGPIGSEERSIILWSTVLMLIIVVPVIIMTLAFAWRYRASNETASFAPDWEHSTRIELVVWLVPCLIVGALGVITWNSTHKLDPYRQIVSDTKPIEVEVVSLDWKWLFIYPELHVASVNELAFPVGTPVHFRLTSGSVMNSFFIPQLGSQIYTMAGMESQLSLLADQPGDYTGLSANFSGDGFSDMQFKARALTSDAFEAWVATARASGQSLTPETYKTLSQPTEQAPVSYYGDVSVNVYHDALNKCSDGSLCTDRAAQLAMAKSTLTGPQAICTPAKPEGL